MDDIEPRPPRALSRRRFVGLAAGAGLLAGRPAAAESTPDVVGWVDRTAAPLRTAGAHGPLDDLQPLRRIVRDAHLVGLGYSAHGTHTQLTLQHRVIRFLVAHLGFRTVAWEESWGGGVVVDRYVTGGGDVDDADEVVGQAHVMLRSAAFLDLVRWLRAFNRGRPEHDKVRFLGADIVELRDLLADEITRYVAGVAPGRVPELRGHLDPLRMRGNPQEHLAWYLDPARTEDEKRELVAHAHAVHDLLRRLPHDDDVVQHARALIGFYDFYTQAGLAQDARDRYIAEFLESWRRRTGHRIVYCAHNAHTAANPRMLTSTPDGRPGDDTRDRALSGGMLRRRYGPRYVSIGTVFHRGQVLTGWERPAGPSVFDVPAPHPSFVDHVLGQAHEPDYLLDLHAGGPPEVRRWLAGPAKTRIISSAYVPADDTHYSQTVDSWRAGFDAMLHVGRVAATRLV